MTRVGVGRMGAALMALAAGMAGAPSANAETLTDALVAAYGGNPTLTGQRAQLRASDEQTAIVRAQGRPTVGVSGTVTQGLDQYRSLQGFNRSLQGGAQLNVPIYQGGRVRSQLHAADARVSSGRETLRSTEGNVFVDVVTAYMDVLRDRAIVQLNENNVKVLQTNLDATGDRFQVGELTRTDVAQSQARLQDGQSQLTTARANQVASEEDYRRVVGVSAGALDQPPPLPTLPASADNAETAALANNPDIASATAEVKARHFDTNAAQAARMPTLSGTAGQNYYHYYDVLPGLFGTFGGSRVSGNYATAGVTLTVPLYQGGAPSAQVRQARDFESVAIESRTATERSVIANVRAAFSNYQASLDVITSSKEALKANTLALEGVRAEQGAGLRQVLDTLNAEQEKLNSEVNLVTAQRNAYVAGFQLLYSMGLVDYKHLGLEGGALYDPTISYNHAKHALGDWQDGPRPMPVARPTYGPEAPPQNNPVTPTAN